MTSSSTRHSGLPELPVESTKGRPIAYPAIGGIAVRHAQRVQTLTPVDQFTSAACRASSYKRPMKVDNSTATFWLPDSVRKRRCRRRMTLAVTPGRRFGTKEGKPSDCLFGALGRGIEIQRTVKFWHFAQGVRRPV